MLQRGLDEAPRSSLAELHVLWNVADEAQAELHLASFATCGWFGPVTRLKASQGQSTASRLEMALEELTRWRQLTLERLETFNSDEGAL